MQWLTYTLIGLALFFLIIMVISYYQVKKASIKLETEAFKQIMRKGQLIDVRTKKEFDSGHINGARNINSKLISREYHKLRKDQPIFLYCATGKRSSRVAILLRSKGYNEVYELKFGLKAWDGPLK